MPTPSRPLRCEPLEDRTAPAAGDLDPTFGTGGRTTVPFDLGGANADDGRAIAALSDGRVLVGGTVDTPSGADFGVARLTSDGTLDPAFGAGGRVRVPFDLGGRLYDDLRAMAAYPDGRVVLAGTVDTADGRAIGVARLSADGALDPAFGGGGAVVFRFDLDGAPVESYAGAVAALPDGGLVVAGGADGVNGGLGVARLTSDGTLDPAFGTGGKAVVEGVVGATGVAVQADGRIVAVTPVASRGIAGLFPSAVSRLTAAGAPDPTFGGDGTVELPFNFSTPHVYRAEVVRVVALQPDGRIVAAGADYDAPFLGGMIEPLVVRLTPDGAFDPTFGAGGRVVLTMVSGSARGVAVQADGRIVVANTAAPTVARLNPDGSPDPWFGQVGITPPLRFTESPTTASSDVAGLALDPDGRIVVGGTVSDTRTGRDFAVARLLGRVPPTISDVPDQVIPGGGSAGPIPFVIGDAETPSDDLFLSWTTDNPGLLNPDFRVLHIPAPGGGDQFIPIPPAITFFGSGADRTLTIKPFPGATGTAVVTVTVTDPDGQTASDTFAVTVLPPPPVLVGGRPDGSAVVFVPADGRYAAADEVTFFPGAAVTVRTALADVTGDGAPDYVGGAGPGGGPNVVVVDGKTGVKVADFYAFEITFTGGVFVAAADLNGDGKAEIVVSPDQGGGPVVAVYDGAKLAAGLTGDAAQVVRFFGIDDPNFHGGARPALGDMTGDGKADLIVSAGFLGGPRIALFDGKSVASGGAPVKLRPDFFAFEDTLRNGAFVAAGDMTGDGVADVAFGGGPDGAPRVRLFDGKALLAAGAFTNLDELPAAQRANFFAGDPALRGGVHLALRDAAGDGTADLLTGSGEGEASRVQVYTSANLLANSTPSADQELDPFGGAVLADGVFVG